MNQIIGFLFSVWVVFAGWISVILFLLNALFMLVKNETFVGWGTIMWVAASGVVSIFLAIHFFAKD